MPSSFRLLDETFQVIDSREDGAVFLEHRLWSLMGAGRTAGEAVSDLLQEAGELAEALRDVKAADMTPECSKMRSFVLRLGNGRSERSPCTATDSPAQPSVSGPGSPAAAAARGPTASTKTRAASNSSLAPSASTTKARE